MTANGWPKVPLDKIVMPVQRPEEPVTGKVYRQIGVRLWGEGAYERDSIDGSQTQYKTLSRVKADDIIVNKIWARNGSVAVVSKDLAGCYASTEFPLFAPISEKLLPRWFHWFTKTKGFWQQCDEKSRGTSGKNRIRPDQFVKVEIPLPPLTEQHRIVARIEELAAKIEEARGLREQAVEEAEALWGAFAAQILRELGEIQRKRMSDICEIRGGLQKSPARLPRDNPTAYITVAHVQRNRIDMSVPPRFFEVSPAELERWRLKFGDLLIIEGNGSADQIGRVALFRDEIENCVHQNHVIRARPNRSVAAPEYLNVYLNSPLGQDEVQRRSRTTSGLRTLSVGRISEIEVPLPTLDEQRRIVAYLDELQAKVDAVKRLQAETSAELNALLPSVLDRAFKGEL